MHETDQLYRLRARTSRVELRLPTVPEIAALARVAQDGVHAADQMPFLVPWTDNIGSATFHDDFLAFHLGLRESWRADCWNLELGVWTAGELVGAQGVRANDFRQSRTVETGSWLGQRFQGRGLGTEMRAAVLELVFSGLGATTAESGSLDGNVASERVSAKLGYAPAGVSTAAPRGTPVREQRFRLDAKSWSRREHVPVEIVGLGPCLPLFLGDSG
jgi:RimJ/RimL family protein N-acetyltransferase